MSPHGLRYKESLQAASRYVAGAYPDNVEQMLVLNLGPAWMNVDAYSLFRNNVIEIPFKYWESPPGMALCPLDVAFTVCSSIFGWLTLNDDHFVVRAVPRAALTPCPSARAPAQPHPGALAAAAAVAALSGAATTSAAHAVDTLCQ